MTPQATHPALRRATALFQARAVMMGMGLEPNLARVTPEGVVARVQPGDGVSSRERNGR